MTRQRLPDRRASLVFGFECHGLQYTASASWFDDGTLGEVFVGNHRADSHADACARDAAILAKLFTFENAASRKGTTVVGFHH
jgi:hypothetical protein